MTQDTTLTFRLDKDLKDRLELLAMNTKRSKSFLAAEAVRDYVESNAWQIEETLKAVERANTGDPFISSDAMTSWLESWGSDEEKPPPTSGST